MDDTVLSKTGVPLYRQHIIVTLAHTSDDNRKTFSVPRKQTAPIEFPATFEPEKYNVMHIVGIEYVFDAGNPRLCVCWFRYCSTTERVGNSVPWIKIPGGWNECTDEWETVSLHLLAQSKSCRDATLRALKNSGSPTSLRLAGYVHWYAAAMEGHSRPLFMGARALKYYFADDQCVKMIYDSFKNGLEMFLGDYGAMMVNRTTGNKIGNENVFDNAVVKFLTWNVMKRYMIGHYSPEVFDDRSSIMTFFAACYSSDCDDKADAIVALWWFITHNKEKFDNLLQSDKLVHKCLNYLYGVSAVYVTQGEVKMPANGLEGGHVWATIEDGGKYEGLECTAMANTDEVVCAHRDFYMYDARNYTWTTMYPVHGKARVCHTDNVLGFTPKSQFGCVGTENISKFSGAEDNEQIEELAKLTVTISASALTQDVRNCRQHMLDVI